MKRFRYKNMNPEGKKVDDCTVRTLALVSGLEWDRVYDDLCDIGKWLRVMPSTNEAWNTWLEANGWKMHEIKGRPDDYNVTEFCAEHPEGSYVLGLRNHVVAVIDGRYYDTWDCGQRPVLFYWTLEV